MEDDLKDDAIRRATNFCATLLATEDLSANVRVCAESVYRALDLASGRKELERVTACLVGLADGNRASISGAAPGAESYWRSFEHYIVLAKALGVVPEE